MTVRSWPKCASCGRATYRCAAVKCAPRVPASVGRTLRRYGRETCEAAYRRHHVGGEGANTVAIALGLKDVLGRYSTAQGDAVINAGRWLATGSV